MVVAGHMPFLADLVPLPTRPGRLGLLRTALMSRFVHVGVALFCLVVPLLVGCTVPIAGALDERDANLVADALNRSGIDATKETDPAAEGRYQVLVFRADSAIAIATLRDHDLPPRNAPGVIDAMGKGSLVPSPLAEHAQFIAGISGDLERSLASVDGILGARVHLSVPQTEIAFDDAQRKKPSASVLIRHRGVEPPVSDEQVRKLVAGAVSGLAADDVSVVAVSRTDAPALPARELTQIGPISVTRSSALWLRLFVGGALSVLIMLALMVLYLVFRSHRVVDGAPDASEQT